jgi:hypothetical protein
MPKRTKIATTPPDTLKGWQQIAAFLGDPQSSTTYRSFVQRYRECGRNAGVQWSIDFNPHPRAWHVVSDDIIYAGSEMNVDTDEFLKSLKSLQVSPCECSAKNPDPDYPNQHTKACPRFQAMHCWCPPATGPGQPHRADCSHYRKSSFKPGFQFNVKHVNATGSLCGSVPFTLPFFGPSPAFPVDWDADEPDDPGPYDPADVAL